MRKLVITLVLITFGSIVYAQPKKASQQWTAFMQGEDVSLLKEKKKFKITASAKRISKDERSRINLWVRVYNRMKEPDFFYSELNPTDEEWHTYSLEGTMNDKTESLYIGGMCEYNGQFFFDDFELFVENEKGVFQKVLLNNPKFEARTIDPKKVPGWTEGLWRGEPFQVDGFTFSVRPDLSQQSQVLMVEGKDVKEDSSAYILSVKGYTSQIGTLVSMLNNLSSRVERVVANMSNEDVDFLMDEKSNTIGALIMHLAAAEVYYQVFTFEHRGFNEEEEKKWRVAFDLGDEARKAFKGKDVQYYLNEYKNVRKKTLEELRKRDDNWLLEKSGGYDGMNNYFSWFHVMEHQSSHLGQILLLKKRIPQKDYALDTVLEYLEK